MVLTTLAIATSVTVILVLQRKWLYILYKTLPRDIKAIIRFIKLNYLLWRWGMQQQTVPKVFSRLTKSHPERIAFYFEDEKWTYSQLDKFSDKVGAYFKKQGFIRGDIIALLLDNRPEYVGIWLGLSKIGVITALINTNLVGDPLVHSVNVVNSDAIIYGQEYVKVINDVSGKLKFNKRKMYQFNGKNATATVLEGAVDLSSAIENLPESEIKISIDLEFGASRERLLFIYTSGTTGLPKAAVITHLRFMFMALGVHFMASLRSDDVLYDPLPLYHSAGGIIGVGQMLLRGIPIALRKKFSASGFWKDCNKFNCTIAQYIGEICRYLLSVSKSEDKPVEHNVRAMFGNGLRPQIWQTFKDKFGIEEIFEFYGATEGNSNLINIDNTPGAVGFVPRYAGPIYPVSLIKCNEATGEPIRDSNGFCIRCQPHEAGVFIGKINPKVTVNAFSGYADKKATEKKVIENVFKKGDMYFNSGDILVYDEFGYYYFKDRTGDTFRWKGENVATAEVEAVISNVSELNDAIVYGVEIPGTEGKAGMAAIVDTNAKLNVDVLCKRLKDNLPSYAFPLFLRIVESLPMTGTFKLKKLDLQKEAYDVGVVKDALYFYNAKANDYERLTKNVYDDIIRGKVRL